MEDQPRRQPAMAAANQEIRDLFSTRGPSTAQVLRVFMLVLLSGVLLLLAGLTLAGTLIGLAVTAPLFVLFSPVLIPAALTIGLTVAGFFTSVAFGVTALFFFTWMLNYLRRTTERPPASDGQHEDAGAPTSSTSPQPSDSGPSAPVNNEKDKSDILVNQQQQNKGMTTLRKADDAEAFSSYATSTESNNYDVFLSFRGLDTRNRFVDHLYNSLVDAGIFVFRDDDELCEGENIGANLFQAIKNSKISIPVLSQNYASSKWCLQELVQMVECMKNGHVILPIFYHVEPADVRYQIGNFGRTFSDLSGKYVEDDVAKWTQALQKVASLKGWDSKITANGREGELVKMVIGTVLSKLKEAFQLVVTEQLVGIDDRKADILRLLDDNPSATQIVGICGMGGIGKTTLAKAIYNKLLDQFRHHSFIADIRESSERKGISCLHNQLIRDILGTKDEVPNEDAGIRMMESRFKHKKVLILLDDVDSHHQLNALIGKPDWFERGSKIMITTRKKSILDDAEVNCQYQLNEIDDDQSLILFCRHAFRRDSPPCEFKSLSHEVISTTGGLPLSLEVIGSFLCGKKQSFWQEALKKLKKAPHNDVQKKLGISYDELSHEEKQIFLDIACFFIGNDLRIASYMWDACDFYPSMGIEKLKFMSLIKIGDNNELKMHDQLRDFGREIVRREDYNVPMKRSRLWDCEEALAVLQRNKGIEKPDVRALRLDKTPSNCEFTTEQFEALPNLRFLQVGKAGDSKNLLARLLWPKPRASVKLIGDSKSLLPELRWLQWEQCPTSVAAVFHLEKLVVLDLSWSVIWELWEGWSHIKVSKELKVLNLEYCDNLKVTPDLSTFQNLEILVLARCHNLEQIHHSIGEVKGLVSLDVSECIKLRMLPGEIGKLEKLKELKMDWTAIEEIPESLGNLKNMKYLDISRSKVSNLPSAIGELGNLEELLAWGCRSLGGEFPIDGLSSLKILVLRSTGVSGFPDTFDKVPLLEKLDLCNCKMLQSLPESISKLPSLQNLLLRDCHQLQSLPELPSCLTVLQVTCQSRTLPQLSHLIHLQELAFLDCKFLESIPGLPSGILKLTVEGCAKLKELPSLSSSEFLLQLDIQVCEERTEIKGLEALKFLVHLSVHGSNKLSKLDGLEHAESLRYLDISSSLVNDDLFQVRGLDRLKNLKVLDISACKCLIRPDLSQCTHLKELKARDCRNLVEIKGLERLKNLEQLDIGQCGSIETLPDLSCLDNLRRLQIDGCEKLGDVQVLEKVYVERGWEWEITRPLKSKHLNS